MTYFHQIIRSLWSPFLVNVSLLNFKFTRDEKTEKAQFIWVSLSRRKQFRPRILQLSIFMWIVFSTDFFENRFHFCWIHAIKRRGQLNLSDMKLKLTCIQFKFFIQLSRNWKVVPFQREWSNGSKYVQCHTQLKNIRISQLLIPSRLTNLSSIRFINFLEHTWWKKLNFLKF